MNKLRKNKWMGIAAPVSLVLALVLSSNVFAGPGKGPRASIKVLSVCKLVYVDDAPILEVKTTVTDKNNGTTVIPNIDANSVTAILGIGNSNGGGKKPDQPKWSVAVIERDGDLLPMGDVKLSVTYTSTFALCDDDRTNTANAANALTEVDIVGGHKEDGWVSYCSDDPLTDEIEGGVPIGHLGLCAL